MLNKHKGKPGALYKKSKILPFVFMVCLAHSRTGRSRTYGVKEGVQSTHKLTSARFVTVLAKDC